MNIKNYVKRLISSLICLALIATSVAIIKPNCYAEEAPEIVTTEEVTVQEGNDAPAGDSAETSNEEALSDSEENADIGSKTKKKKTDIDKLVAYAKKQIGKPYRYGGFGPGSFDCIGYVYYVFANAGVDLKTSMTKKKACSLKKSLGKYIVSGSLKDAKAGDIIAFYSGNKTKHAAIALGNGKGIWAHKKGGIKTGKLKGYGGCKVAVIRITK